MAGDVFFYDAETGEITGENGEPYSFEEIEFEIPVYNSSSEDGIAPAGGNVRAHRRGPDRDLV